MKLRTFLPVLFFMITGMLVSATGATAKIWRINNTPGVHRDFAELSTAVASNFVGIDDTLYVEPSANGYLTFTLNKRLVIIGAGYLLTAIDGNPGLQYNTNNSFIHYMYIDSLGSGSQLIGIRTDFYLNSNVDDIKISRCYGTIANGPLSVTNSTINNLQVHSCLLTNARVTYFLNNPQITNCIFSGNNAIPTFPSANNMLFRNNTISKSGDGMSLVNAYIANNIFNGPTAINVVNCTMKNNLATTNVLPAGNNNMNNVAAATLFVGGTSMDGQYQLSAASPARNAGETINGITPDCGAFGTAAPYRLSGIPPVPTIYALSVPVAVPASAASMNITISTRSNN